MPSGHFVVVNASYNSEFSTLDPLLLFLGSICTLYTAGALLQRAAYMHVPCSAERFLQYTMLFVRVYQVRRIKGLSYGPCRLCRLCPKTSVRPAAARTWACPVFPPPWFDVFHSGRHEEGTSWVLDAEAARSGHACMMNGQRRYGLVA